MERDRDLRQRDRHRDKDREREREIFRERDRDVDRERERGRERDGERGRSRFDRRRGETTRIGAGESYKPYSSRPRTPPRIDTFHSKRDRSPRREQGRSPSCNWHLNSNRDRSPRRRTRSPTRRDRSTHKESWRLRSPRRRTPTRRLSPRKEHDRRPKSSSRREERNSRSPFDNRLNQRIRTPVHRVSPPVGPRGFRPRSRSTDRRDDPKGSHSSRKRRSHTPTRDSDRSALNSTETSRRPSPPTYSHRKHLTQGQPKQRSPVSRAIPSFSHQVRNSAKKPLRERPSDRQTAPRSPPRAPASHRTPTGPIGSRNFTSPAPNSSKARGFTTIARPKIENNEPLVPPVGPRGYVPRGASSIRVGRGSFGSDRVTKSDVTSWGTTLSDHKPSGPESIRLPTETTKTGDTTTNNTPKISSPSQPSTPLPNSVTILPSSGVPTGPRAGGSSRPNLVYQSSSTMYSRSIKLASTNNTARSQITLANTVSILPSGKIDPTATGIAPDIAARLKRKEEEEEILRAELHSKEEKLRQSLKHWDKLSRDSRSMGLRSDLSEQHVRTLAGEGVGGSAF